MQLTINSAATATWRNRPFPNGQRLKSPVSFSMAASGFGDFLSFQFSVFNSAAKVSLACTFQDSPLMPLLTHGRSSVAPQL